MNRCIASGHTQENDGSVVMHKLSSNIRIVACVITNDEFIAV